MSLKKGDAPETIQSTLTIKSQGQDVTLEVVFYNRKASEVRAKVESGATVPDIVLYLVKSWSSDYALSVEGLDELEDDRPGTCMAVWQGFNQARMASLEKN